MSDDNVIRITESDIDKIEQQNPTAFTVQNAVLAGKPTSDALGDFSFAPSSKESVDLILVIDTSGSMGAADYPPNRLTAAKEAAKEFTHRKVVQGYNDRVGIVSFGGSPRVVHPLNADLDKVAKAIDSIKITHSGTMIGRALAVARKELDRSSSPRKAIILLSDGGDAYDTSQPVQVAQSCKGIKIFTVGIGTLEGGKVQLPHGTQQVHLNEKLLRQVAQVSGGEYVYAQDVNALRGIYLKLADY